MDNNKGKTKVWTEKEDPTLREWREWAEKYEEETSKKENLTENLEDESTD
tara:strand:+ start:282 stop:431 length:150 start_codon:yes stop_codon:yes gene_type:complete